MVITPNALCKNRCFYKYAHSSSPRGVPDMIFSAFDMKFHDKKMRYLPGPVDLQKSWKKTMSKKWTPKKSHTKQCRKSVPQKNLKKLCREKGPKQSWKTTMSKKWTPKKSKENYVEKMGSYSLIYLHTSIYFHIPSYTLIYLQIALYTFIYPHIHQNIDY